MSYIPWEYSSIFFFPFVNWEKVLVDNLLLVNEKLVSLSEAVAGKCSMSVQLGFL